MSGQQWRTWLRTPVLFPASKVDRGWAAIGSASELAVAQAIEALLAGVDRSAPAAVVVRLEPADFEFLRACLDQAERRIAGLVAARAGGLRTRVRIEAGPAGVAWTVRQAGTASGQYRPTRVVTAVIEQTSVVTPQPTPGPPVDRTALVALGLRFPPAAAVIVVPSGGLVLGRAVDGPGRLDDARLSRRHCAVELGHGCVVVRDLGSRNGTWVGGARIAVATEVAPGERFHLGRVEVLVEPLGGGR